MTENELVRYSRAGDAFHYRWAARRCLRLVYPKSILRSVVIEGSEEHELEGEYVIDVTEYSDTVEGDKKVITYFQLKHTTVRKEQPLKLSDLEKTIIGFAHRSSDHIIKENKSRDSQKITFTIVTNRPIDENLKRNIFVIAKGGKVATRFQRTLEKYTNLKGEDLEKFCGSVEFVDGEGDYVAQRYELHAEICQLLAGIVDSTIVDSVTALVHEKTLPNSDGLILREDILKRLGVSSERDLFPAPPEIEKIDKTIQRKQHQILLDQIFNASTPIIIHAAGGVGKSIFAQQIIQTLPPGSMGVIYDCFGGGRYRNRSEPRHRHRDALVQIANELAAQGLCDPLIAPSTVLEDEILRKYLARISVAAKSLRKANESAILLIVIDAADNAEMAANEVGQLCFAHELLREPLPDGCRLVAFCRTERIQLLQPNITIPQLELETFSFQETLAYLRIHFPQATDFDGLEFHRLTSGNPRVQANALGQGSDNLVDILARLGPSGTTIEKQIELQLDFAILKVKEKLSTDYQQRIDAICVGLATLPPFIPLKLLATSANVEEAAVKSFIADLGRPLWLSDNSVQFRDEPTETWFREKFSATSDQISSYISRLEPLAHKYSYVAETLPSLLLQAGKFNELILLALSDDLLPENNPIDERNIRIYRLQFAFRAALKLKRYSDATKLALRAGEEMAGDKRQLALLTENVDLIAPLQNEQRVQELAFRRMLHGDWDGSENVYSAALLSSVKDFQGEARGYLRAATNWLHLYFEERKKKKEKYHQDNLKKEDVVELAFTHLNLFGVKGFLDFILGWQPPILTYQISRIIIKRIIDAGKFAVIEEILNKDTRNQYLTIAAVSELFAVGRLPPADSMNACLNLLTTKRIRIPKPDYSYSDTLASAIMAFIEACAAKKLSKVEILRVLRHYFPIRASQYVATEFPSNERDIYLRSVALRSVLSGNIEPNLDDLLPKEVVEDKTYKREQDVREFKEKIGKLLPWYIFRARVLVNDISDLSEGIKFIADHLKDMQSQVSRDADTIPHEISRICLDIPTRFQNIDHAQVEMVIEIILKQNSHMWIQDSLNILRTAFRLDHFSGVRKQLELFAYDTIRASKNEDPETRADWYIDLARAVLPANPDEAAAYFHEAIEAVSKFGDEILKRWEAVAALANRCATQGHISTEMAYRFMRCAELIGDNAEIEYNEAVKTCVKLSPESALSIISRWRDREVGSFEREFPGLVEVGVNSNFITSSVGWSLIPFFKGYKQVDFAFLCIEKEPIAAHRQLILDSVIRDLRLNEAGEEIWNKLKQISDKFNLHNSDLDSILSFYSEHPTKKKEETSPQLHHSILADQSEPFAWGKVFDDLDLATSLGISQAISRFRRSSIKNIDYGDFWKEVFERIKESDVSKFLAAIANSEGTDRYDIQRAIRSFPKDWRNKVSVKRYWPTFLKLIVHRFAPELTIHYILENFRDALQIESATMPFVYEQILEGLSANNNFSDASTFFGFVEIAAKFISAQDASDLLDFALLRFELHIDDEYADGRWSSWLEPPADKSNAIAGLIWSALGSPRAVIRWQAAHCVRMLADFGCESELNALIQWMETDNVGAFGSNKFPFYNLHARQYLLIALARTSIDHPEILKHHYVIFSRHALDNIFHILIQKFATEIALNIEKRFPGTYDNNIVEKLNQVGTSQLPVIKMDRSEVKQKSYWHEKGLVDTNLKFFHGWDFDEYWLEPLAEVFGIPKKEVEDLATEIIVKEWGIFNDGGFNSDPRADLWRSSRSEQEIWNHHGSYPRVDNYSFYLSYHSMLVIAAKLLQKMPVIHSSNWHEDEWLYWLHRHSLTRSDGRWLSDRRDPAPLLQREWMRQAKPKNWLLDIKPIDFWSGILIERNGETFLTIDGWWGEGDGGREENYYISTALVFPQTSQSLLNALSTCSDPNDFKLPDDNEADMEINSPPFELKGWTWRPDTDNRLDENDALAGPISYPPYQIGRFILDKMSLKPDIEKREWFLPNTDRASLVCELWSTNKIRRDEEPLRHGGRLSASLTFLKNLCSVLEFELIFKIEISRYIKSNSYSTPEDGDNNGFGPTYCKILILSADGKLRDTDTSYQLR